MVRRAVNAPRAQRIAERLRDATVLLTGASGFLGKAVLGACLRELDQTTRLRLALRAADDDAARRRLVDEILSSPAVRAAGDADAALDAGRLRALAIDLSKDDLGRTDPPDLSGVDVVVHCAASVSFEQPLDEILDLNVRGPLRLLRALRAAGADPHFVHVSTAYAAGMRTGLVLERPYGQAPGEPDVDLDAELDAARAWRRELESDSRRPEHQRRFVAEAQEELAPAGALAVGARAETARHAWVASELTERGRARCRALGWADGYSLSKALAERALVAARPRALTILRPSIIESALRDPYPGWLEGLKVADPVILAYARGLVPRFPGEPAVRLDLVPVDLVANACLAAAGQPPDEAPRTVAIASGRRNPLTMADISEWVTTHFRERPLPDEEGQAVEVPDWRFDSAGRIDAALDRGELALRVGRRVVDRVALPRADAAERRLHRERRRLERLRRLTDIYGPYVEVDCMFDDAGAQALAAGLHPGDRERLDFDTAGIPWRSYIDDVHLPALRALVGADRPARPRPARAPRPARETLADGPPALALFDVEGVILDATVAHFYAWLRTRGMPAPDRTVWLARHAAKAPGWLAADRSSRAAFNRRFYREYAGLPALELRAHAREALSDFILPRMRHGAVRRIRAHRRRGDRVVLVTGALDFLVEPLAHLADELVAARMDERRGALTGELAEPPLTAEGRAALATRLAADRGVALADCHAYADGISDLPLLDAVGHPHAVNPDFRLAREARRRRWPVLAWPTEPGARARPPAPVAV